MFRPPVNRAMRLLDRAFFSKDCPISAARIFDIKNVSRIRNDFAKSKDILVLRQIMPIKPDPDAYSSVNRKCLLLRPEIKHDGESVGSNSTQILSKSQRS